MYDGGVETQDPPVKDPLGLLKPQAKQSDPLGLLSQKKKDSPHDFGMGYQPTQQDIQQKQALNDFQSGLDKSATGSTASQSFPTDPHQQAIQRAKNLPKPQAVKQEPKPEEGITDKIANALYLPAFNQGVNGLLIKPFLGGSDFIGRTTDKLYRAVTGAKETPQWLYDTKGTVVNSLSKNLDKAYQQRDKPKNTVSEVAEGAIGTVPLVASLFTGGGEASLASKAPQLVSKVTKLLATTTALKSYHEATEQGKDYTESLKDAAKGGVEGAEQGLTLDAQMLLGGALGKGVVNKVVEKGLLKGGKAGEALLHALSTATIFGGTPVVKDLLAGQNIDTHEALKNFGMGLMFEAMPVAKGLHDEVSDRIGESQQNTQAAQQAVMATAASHLHSESVLQTLIGHDKDQLNAINTEIPGSHEDLYAQSIEQGMKGYESKNPTEKRDLLANQLLLKTQGDVKFIAQHDNKELLDAVTSSDELEPAEKANLINKITSLSKNEQTESNTQVSAQQPADETTGQGEAVNQNDETTENNQITNPQSNEKGNVVQEGQENEKTGNAQENEKDGQNGEKGQKNDVDISGVPDNAPETTKHKGGTENAIQEQGTESIPVQSKTENSGEVPKGNTEGEKITQQGEKPRYKIKGEVITKLPLAEHSELNNLLKEDGIDISHLKDANNTQRDSGGDQNTQVTADAEAIQQPENDGLGNAGKDRPGESVEGSKSSTGKTTFKKPTTESEGGKEVKKTILTKRAYEGTVSDEVKAHLEDKGLTRKSFSQEERSKQATAFINKFGDDAAFRAVEAGDVDGGLAASILAQLQIKNSSAVEDLPEDSEQRDEISKKHADLIALMEKKGYFSGEFIGQLAHEYQNKELNFASIKRQIEKLTKKPLTGEQEKKIKEVTAENDKLKAKVKEAEAKLIEETDKAFLAGKESVKDETNAEKAKRIADKLRKNAKLSRPGVFSSASPASLVWDTAVEVTAKSIEAGGKVADAIQKGIDHIKQSDWYKQLSASKKALAENEFKRVNNGHAGSTDLSDLQARFVDKSDNKFSPDEARDIWGYMKKTYLENGVSYRDALSKTVQDLGLSWRQVSEAIVTPKLKRTSDEMWKRQSEYARNRSAIKTWIGEHESSAPIRALKKISGLFRGVAVFAHGHIFIGTHAGMTLFQPSTWNKVIPAFFRGFKLAYGSEASYEKAMEELKNSPNYLIAQRAGLKNDPDRINNEEYQKSQQYLGKLGTVGERGFNTIKVLRQNLFDYEFNKRSPAEQDDPEVAKNIAKLMNLATGATNLHLPSWVNEVTFAGGMETSRWGKLISSPAKATQTALNAIFAPDKASVSDRVFAKVWARRVGEQMATYTTGLVVNAAINNTLFPDDKKKLFDPTDPNWWKYKFGSMTVDPSSGMRSAANFIYGLAKTPFKSTSELHGDSRIKNAAKQAAGYGRGKLAPLYGTIADFVENKDFSGNVMPKFSIKALNRKDKPGSGHHNLTWAEYASSKLPLPIAEAFGVFYQSAMDHGAHKKTLDNALTGILAGAISGTTGFRVGESHDKKMKKVLLSK